MTDIVDRLRGPAPSIMAMRDGAGEIDHLRYLVEDQDAKIKALTEALAERDRLLQQVWDEACQNDDKTGHLKYVAPYCALAQIGEFLARAALAGTEG